MTLPAHGVRRPPRPGAAEDADGETKRIAAIDIGSNSIRQIVADVDPTGSIRIVDEMKAAPRLGAGVGRTGRIDEEAMRRAADAVGRMATLARQLGASRIEVVATSAVRDAGNGGEFLRIVQDATGLAVRSLSGEEEARLAWRSALAHFDLGSGRAVVMDIGGGSMELALSADGVLERLAEYPLGALRMTEEHLGSEPRRRDVRALRSAVRKRLRRTLPFKQWRGAALIGSGGTFTNLAGMLLARQGGPAAGTVQGTRVSPVELEHLLETLTSMSSEERRAVPGLSPARADIIIGGLAVIAEVAARFEAREIVVSAYGIREGLLLEGARITPAAADPGEVRARSVRQFAERCHFEAPHAEQVQRLAVRLFDAIGERLGCEPGDRQILADAALLHDVGYLVSYQKHHKHSYHLILHAELLGMNPTEQVIVANVARYHRGAPPKKKHRNFGSLDKPRRDQVVRLSALLRIADGLDRGHIGAVETVRVRWLVNGIRITPIPRREGDPLRLELWGAARKSDLLSRITDVPVRLIDPQGREWTPDEPTPAVAPEEQQLVPES